jgi:PKD repeat protein
VVVYVNLTPTFTWSFGDGGLFITTMQGAPFPIGGITHTYKKSGDYSVNLRVTWNGTFSVNGITTPISGNAITQSINRTISVAKAPTRFTK